MYAGALFATSTPLGVPLATLQSGEPEAHGTEILPTCVSWNTHELVGADDAQELPL